MKRLLPTAIVSALIGCAALAMRPQQEAAPVPPKTPELGAFSISLAVKDLAASRAFYEKLGFVVSGGQPEQKWLVLRSGPTVIGLFQGMFEKNMLTFNPGWSTDKEQLEQFTDVRELQQRFLAAGLEPTVRASEEGDGPAHLVLTDPDGNPLLFDQHVPRPK